MKKIVQAREMARIEKHAYQLGENEEVFMNRAGEGVAELAQRLIALYHLKPEVTLLCGHGNNAGDAFRAGEILIKGGFLVRAFSPFRIDEGSPLGQLQAERFIAASGIVTTIMSAKELILKEGLIIDGIFGTGFKGKVEGVIAEIIESANASGLPILSIDIPSGINGDTGEKKGAAIRAAHTLFLGLPKTGCFYGEAWNHVGKIHTFDFGLPNTVIEATQEDFQLIEPSDIKGLFPRLVRTRHKYQAGYVIGIGGSVGMPGAPILSCTAALRAGAGIVRLLHPLGMESELAGAPFEIIREGFRQGAVQNVLKSADRASAIFIGPGMSRTLATHRFLKKLIPQIQKPCVIDAEALSVFKEDFTKLPPHFIFTPHHGEMKTLLNQGSDISIQTLLELSQKFSRDFGITLVLKGAPTFIISPEKKPWVCPKGDPGLATAGSGDVLTGMIAAFLAQGKNCEEAAILGVSLHAESGEEAASELSSYSLLASDLYHYLPRVLRRYQTKW
jgi:hydroxyethylthiazole kinase-like uncharacterized protein yjeF